MWRYIVITHHCTCILFPAYFSQWQLQSWVHFQRAFLHAHRAPHVLWILQLHLICSLQALETTGNMFHTGTHELLSSSRAQPQPSGVGACCSICSMVHHIPAWYATRFVCCNSASCIGGSLSIVFPFWKNSSFLASSTCCRSLVLSYRITVKRYSNWKCWAPTSTSV